jgi:hypothetical protein
MSRQDYEHMIGETYTLKPSITSRPGYFNVNGLMDRYLDGVSFKAVDVFRASFGWGIEIKDGENHWYIGVDDVVPLQLDNRKVRAHG